VIFSAIIGYLIGMESFSLSAFLSVIFGGLFITAASNGLNQIAEREIDKLMKRTQNRPMPTGRMNMQEAYLICFILGILGTLILWIGTNKMAAILSVFSMVLYAYMYTPLKRISPVSGFVGAIPGALPPLLGWVAARGFIGFEALLLFFIQFMWQFPHFWAIAWRTHDDYSKAGIMLLPLKNGLSKENAMIIFLYTLMLVPAGWLPYFFNFCSLWPTIGITICSLYFLYKAFRLLKTCDMKEATGLMFASFIYLPVVQLLLYLSVLISR
jgi:protoheme IX farnesyltransferase